MSSYRLLFQLIVLTAVFWLAARGEGAEPGGGLPDGPGRDLLMSRCYQCHGESMWQDQRLDRRGWEAALYPMVGRGALWAQDEINAMAAYFGTARGPQA